METEPASKSHALKTLDNGKSAPSPPKKKKKGKKKIISVNSSCALFSLLDFLTFEAGIDRLSQNVGKDLPLYTA